VTIDYDHSQNLHTTSGPRAAWPVLFEDWRPRSILDVGCGTGVWLSAALQFGVSSVFGVDGVDIPPARLQIPADRFLRADLTRPLALERRFDVALCLEVGEHLPAAAARTLVQSLTRHADCVVFSAACPGQPGQHHLNCQWPAYWQQLFNGDGFACDDHARWRLWDLAAVEPWYRQNLFVARRDERAGTEPRIRAVIHPAMLRYFTYESYSEWTQNIADGALPVSWYVSTPFTAFVGKVRARWVRSRPRQAAEG
jgi:SAM-dependent methyltransferase